MNGLKKIFGNKGFVTIAASILCLVILAFAYTSRINDLIKAVPVPIAKQGIPARTKITNEHIKIVNVPSSMLSDNVIRNSNELITKYSNYNTIIPAGSLFYKSAVTDEEYLPDSAWSNIPEGYTVVSFPVTETTTFGNSIFPGTYIDIYYNTRDNGLVVYGKLIEGIKILAVKDGKGNHIFNSTGSKQEAQAFIFAVPEDLHLLFRKAYAVSGPGSLVPVPRNKNYTPDATTVTSEYLKGLILSKTREVPLDVIDTKNNNEKNTNVNINE